MNAVVNSDFYIKDPAANLDYTIDWTEWLNTDVIISATWTVPDALTGTDRSNTSTAATIFISGGAVGITYSVICDIVTANGRTDARELLISIEPK